MNSFFGILLSCVCLRELSARPVDQVKHVIIFMQENRPFDHYFGMMKGVRGFNDRTPIMLSSGRDAFFQPVDEADDSKYMLPFRTIANETNAMCMPAPDMSYPTDTGIWNEGRFDRWNTVRNPGYGMAYFTREDLPYYYELFENFAIGDHYYQSSFTQTIPNRLYLFSGSNGLSAGYPAVVDNTQPHPGYNWTTVGETLLASNISWRVYQQHDNFDDNGFAWFASFQQSKAGEYLHDHGLKRTNSLIQTLREDVESGNLPQVSFIIAPTRKSEHASHHPCAGEDFTARILQVLQENPAVYAESVFILNYDEGGQFYDHLWSPTPPMPSTKVGYSSVTVDGEVFKDEAWTNNKEQPIGLGFRVPLLIVSPWTRGNVVVSEVFDHTSVLQFLEVWGNVTFSTISEWRRLVTGDLMSAFNWDSADYSWPVLPDTSEYVKDGDVECHTLANPTIPTEQAITKQEKGTKISRALGYEVQIRDTVSSSSMMIEMINSGSVGIPLILFDALNLKTTIPFQYALSPDPAVVVTENVKIMKEDGSYRFALHAPNGFMREFRGNAQSCYSTVAYLQYSPATGEVVLQVRNENNEEEATMTVVDNAYSSFEKMSVTLKAGESKSFSISTLNSGNWYDISVSQVDSKEVECYFRRFLGRMETGKDTVSDPAMSEGVETWIGNHNPSEPLPEVHVSYEHLKYDDHQK
jgi:phospholipase C